MSQGKTTKRSFNRCKRKYREFRMHTGTNSPAKLLCSTAGAALLIMLSNPGSAASPSNSKSLGATGASVAASVSVGAPASSGKITSTVGASVSIGGQGSDASSVATGKTGATASVGVSLGGGTGSAPAGSGTNLATVSAGVGAPKGSGAGLGASAGVSLQGVVASLPGGSGDNPGTETASVGGLGSLVSGSIPIVGVSLSSLGNTTLLALPSVTIDGSVGLGDTSGSGNTSPGTTVPGSSNSTLPDLLSRPMERPESLHPTTQALSAQLDQVLSCLRSAKGSAQGGLARAGGCSARAPLILVPKARPNANLASADLSYAKRLQALQDENVKLKQLLAEAMLNNLAMKEVASKN